jgi:hypothetical protein
MKPLLLAATEGNGRQTALAGVALIAIIVAISWLKALARRATMKAAAAGVQRVARVESNGIRHETTGLESADVRD